MATWITHLRVAQRLLDEYPWLDTDAFLLGNIAPDSGVPTGDGLHYTPDKAVSHFRTIDEQGVKRFRTDLVADRYLTGGQGRRDVSFLMGYIAHLATDSVWNRVVLLPLVERFPEEYRQRKAALFAEVKRDWYDLDFLYLREPPGYEPLRRYLAIPDVTNGWLDIFAPDAFAQRREYIRAFYEEGVRNVSPRPMTYLTAAELDAFVAEAARTVMTEHSALFVRFSDSVL